MAWLQVTWTLAILVVSLTLLTKVFLPSQSNNTEISSPNIDQANEQNIVPSNAGQIGDQVNNSQEIDSSHSHEYKYDYYPHLFL